MKQEVGSYLDDNNEVTLKTSIWPLRESNERTIPTFGLLIAPNGNLYYVLEQKDNGKHGLFDCPIDQLKIVEYHGVEFGITWVCPEKPALITSDLTRYNDVSEGTLIYLMNHISGLYNKSLEQ